MVQYSPKLTFGPEAADWQERFNPDRMRRQRFERAQMLMRKYGIATLLEANHQNIRVVFILRIGVITAFGYVGHAHLKI